MPKTKERPRSRNRIGVGSPWPQASVASPALGSLLKRKTTRTEPAKGHRSGSSRGCRKKYLAVDCFAGIGGLRLGFEPHGVECVWSCEYDTDAAETYRRNFGDDPTGDMTLQDPYDIPEHDILLAGWPCQDISPQGKRQGLRGEQSSKITYIYDILVAKMPRAFVLENVAHLLSRPMERDFESVKGGLEQAGYYIGWSLLNARNFGLPQNRERVFIVGFDRDVGHFEFPAGGPAAANIAEFLEREVPERYYLSAEGYETIRKGRLEQADIGNNHGYHFIRDGFAATLLANPDKRKDNIWIDAEGRMRFLTPREYARLQGFPDDFWLPSDDCECDEKRMRSNDRKVYRQVGNSVPVAVVSEIAKCMVAVLRKSDRVESATR